MQLSKGRSDEDCKTWEDLREIVGEEGPKGAHKANAFCTPSVKPVEPMHGVSWLQHLHREPPDANKVGWITCLDAA